MVVLAAKLGLTAGVGRLTILTYWNPRPALERRRTKKVPNLPPSDANSADRSVEANPTGSDSGVGAASPKHLQRKASMGRLMKMMVAALGVTLVVGVGTFWYLYRTATAAVPEYEAILAETAEPELVEEDRQRFESQMTTLYSDTQKQEEWQARITESEINAWLALRIEGRLPDLKKHGLSDPRVLLDDQTMTLAIRSKVGSTQGVLSVEVVPFATKDGELALKITGAKIGQLAMPVGRVVEMIEQAPFKKKLPIRIIQSEGSPVILVSLASLLVEEDTLPRLVGFDIREDELLIRGESKPIDIAN